MVQMEVAIGELKWILPLRVGCDLCQLGRILARSAVPLSAIGSFVST